MVVTRRKRSKSRTSRRAELGVRTSPVRETAEKAVASKSTKKTRTVSVITKTVVTKSKAGQSLRTSSQHKSLADEVDPWEVLPKTGYTYAESPSYNQKYLDQDWEIPNMSRSRLRSEMSCSMTSTNSSTDALSSSQTGNYSQQKVTHSESWHDRRGGYTMAAWQRNQHAVATETEVSGETADHQMTLPASVTRSGRRSRSKRHSEQVTSSSRGEADIHNLSVEEYMQLEKDMEYSGESMPYKETSKLSLYGLDHADDLDFSDTEVVLQSSTGVPSSHTAGFLSSFVWSIITAITSIWRSKFLTSESMSTRSENLVCDDISTKNHTTAMRESHTTTLLSDQRCTQEHYNNVEEFSDEDLSESTINKSEKYSLLNEMHKTAYEVAEESTDNQDTWCGWFCYVLIAMAYVLFIALPAGLFKAAKTSAVWLFAYLLLPFVDGAKALTAHGYSALTSASSTSAEIVTVSIAGSTVTEHSSVVVKSSQAYTGWLSSVAYYGDRTWSAVCGAAHAVAGILWMPLAASSTWLYHGLYCSWCWRLGTWIHQLAARVLLLDVWILSRSHHSRGCCCLLPLLFLLLALLLLPVTYYWLEALTKEPLPPVFNSDKVQIPADTADISYATLRKIINEKLSTAKAEMKEHSTDLYKDNLAYIQRLEKQINDKTLLLAQLSDCCKDDAYLSGLISKNVQEQLSLLLYGSGSGGSIGGDSAYRDGKSGQISHSAFVHWLDAHLSKSTDYDARIAALTESLNKKLKEQSEATRAALLAAERAEQVAVKAMTESKQAADIAVLVEEAQGAQAALWAKDKAGFEALLADMAANLKSTERKASSASETAETANTAAAEAARTAAAAAAAMNDLATDQGSVGDVSHCGGYESTGQSVVLPENYQAVTQDQVRLLIREALGIFGADKTGMVDYALESAGGSVISTRCSETYHRRTAQLSLFGFPLWYMSNSPRTVIQPEVQPGQCWAFKGSQGYIVLQLAGWVKPTSFSLEHIPKVLSPTGKIDSAPKDFTVWGLKFERDTDGQLLGNYTYLDNGEPLQFFQVQQTNVGTFHLVELRIHSNHGNQEYTCLYRFRVHGVLVRS